MNIIYKPAPVLMNSIWTDLSILSHGLVNNTKTQNDSVNMKFHLY